MKSPTSITTVKCASCNTLVSLSVRSLNRKLENGRTATCSYACSNKQMSKLRNAKLLGIEEAFPPVVVTSKRIIDTLQKYLSQVSANAQHQTILKAIPDKYKSYWYGIQGTPRVKLHHIKEGTLPRCTCGIYFGKHSKYCSHKCFILEENLRDKEKIDAFNQLRHTCTKSYIFTKSDVKKYKSYLESWPNKSISEYLFVDHIINVCNDPDFAVRYLSQRTTTRKGRYYLAHGGAPATCHSCGKSMLLRYTSEGNVIRYCSSKCSAVNPATTERRLKTNMKRYGTLHVARLPNNKYKSRATAMAKYGVSHFSKSEEGRASRYKYYRKEYILDGRKIRVQGYEPFALDYILLKGVNPKDIHTKDVPIVNYRYKLNPKTYLPDIWIPKKNILVEVKSTYTLVRDLNEFQKNCAKARAALRDGYDFRLLVFKDDGTRVKLPKNWYALPFNEVKSLVGIR